MNSSGIKRGLAVSAVSAMAVVGIPALATSANAAVGDNFTVAYTGPALNGGDEGALVIIRAQDGEITPGELEVTGTSSPSAGSEDTADQTVDILGTSGPVNDPADSDYEFIQVRVKVTTATTGDTASFRLFEDDSTVGPGDFNLDASEARQSVSISTAGPLASIDVSPATQSSPENIESGAYTVTLKDAAGRTTQLPSTDSLDITNNAVGPATVTINETGPDTAADDDTITSDEIVRGTDTFKATGNTAGSYNIVVTDATTATIKDTAVLNVTEAAVLTKAEIDIVTAADTWNGLDNTPDSDTDPTKTFVRVDQNTIRFDFDAAVGQAGANVQLTVDGNGVTFAGQDQATYTTTLDASGNGSITVTVDAATIQEGDDFDVDINGFAQTIEFDRAEATTIDGESATYFCQDDASCTVTAVVKDQFGNPVTSGEVAASRTGHNVDATPQRKPVGSDGTVDFTFADANTADGGTDTVLFEYFVDQFANTAEFDDNSTTIKYSATGQGSDYAISLDTVNTEAATYKPADAAVISLTDTVADEDGTGLGDDGDEDAVIGITGGEASQAVTLSVDNGALILATGETKLSEGSASVNATLDGGGVLPAGYRIVGTQSGPVTLTVDTAGRTETAQLVVLDQTNLDAVRNVTVSGPAEVESGATQIQFTAVITDAFGNPVANVPVSALNIQVTGPAQFQDSDAVSNADGQLNLNLRVDSDAEGDVTIRVQGLPNWGQFGAEADRVYSSSNTDDGEGLPVSADVATATTTVKAAPVEPTRVDAQLVVTGKGARVDRVKANAISEAAGAKATLWVKGKKVKAGVLNDNGNITFRVKDKNGNKATRYVVKIGGTALTFADRDAKRIR